MPCKQENKAWLLIPQAWLHNMNPLTCQHNLQWKNRCLQFEATAENGDTVHVVSLFCFRSDRPLTLHLAPSGWEKNGGGSPKAKDHTTLFGM